MKAYRLPVILIALTAGIQPVQSQPHQAGFEGALRWRSIGPYRGGRVTAGAIVT
jgi:hypothetical protein